MYCMVSKQTSFRSDSSMGGEQGEEPEDEVGDSYPNVRMNTKNGFRMLDD